MAIRLVAALTGGSAEQILRASAGTIEMTFSRPPSHSLKCRMNRRKKERRGRIPLPSKHIISLPRPFHRCVVMIKFPLGFFSPDSLKEEGMVTYRKGGRTLAGN